jgi:hypothetical protein
MLGQIRHDDGGNHANDNGGGDVEERADVQRGESFGGDRVETCREQVRERGKEGRRRQQ